MLKTVYLIAATLMILLPTVPAQAQFNPLSILTRPPAADIDAPQYIGRRGIAFPQPG